ncbi:MAG: ABC transporter permease [Phycisphaerae bacterium]|nr:MAG: ABC transporter permease [Planctomycetota bacterium]KAB2948947.1 MAG: ABC transporter permease [Phycisphaerae bacterium]MBE7456003.1 ABC transporter permease [Planctomycetia bacterium]MCK6465130.1 ABC transporter permease [Phycisphaerae bacterium]MCL4717261.1 ABC transporter permease [Phycisphaerae bacterium]
MASVIRHTRTDERVRFCGLAWRRDPLTRRLTILAAAWAMMMLGAGAFNPSLLSPGALAALLVDAAPAVIVGTGLTLLVISGEIDVSVGSLLGLLAAVAGLLSSPSHAGLSAWAAAGVVVAAGAVAGLLNGLLVVFGRVPSLLATLGMLSAWRGATELLLSGNWITDAGADLRKVGQEVFLGLPAPIWIAGIVATATIVLAQRTRLGRRTYAVGDHEEAARLAGVPVAATKMLMFVLTGAMTGVAALVSLGQTSVIESGIGAGFELTVVTAVVVGGTSIRGGAGTIAGTALAVFWLGSVRTVLVHLKLGESATHWERAIAGMCILAAVLLDHLSRRRGGTRGTGPATLEVSA